MSAEICPTVTTDDPAVYRKQIEETLAYAHRLHIDLSDGVFTRNKLMDLSDGVFTRNKLMDIEDVWWPGGVRADLHVMYQRPFDHMEALVALRPQLIIVHAEADGDFMEFAATVHHYGIEVGVALLPETPVDAIMPAMDAIDHVLIFSGNLGHFGGHADMSLLGKAQRLHDLKPRLELGWDGGVNADNVRLLAAGGIEVLNAGGYLHGAKDSASAYATLKKAIEG